MRHLPFLLAVPICFVVTSCSGSDATSPAATETDFDATTRTGAAYGQLMIKPTSNIVSQEFSGGHPGVDIGNPKGTPVYAAASGVVVAIRTGSYNGDNYSYGGAGNFVVIQHKPGDNNPYRRWCPLEEWTFYFHLNTVNVSVGQIVQQGQFIGTVGNTGRSYGDHLHFEIRLYSRYGSASNPREWIRFGYSSKTGGKDIW